MTLRDNTASFGIVAGALLSGCAQIIGIEDLPEEQDDIEEIVDAAPEVRDGADAGVPCVDVSRLNAGVFSDVILFGLAGRVDWNDVGSGRTQTGCAQPLCHGTKHGPGRFHVSEDSSDEENLASFACFIDPAQPSRSQILVCPLNINSCEERPHPGGDVFFGPDDRNYQRILAYLYSIEGVPNPYDFAFYVRRIEPILNDPEAVEDGAWGLSCASGGCHRSLAIGEPPESGSNFGIIPAARTEEELRHNYRNATAFLHFPDPSQSALYLYPTDEIADEENNDFATGFGHAGGGFATSDPEAQAVLQWAGGLRPDTQGRLRHWLVAGDFDANDITDAIPDEAEIEPRIFLRSGQPAEFHDGLWDTFFSTQAFIDLNQMGQGFFRAAPTDRLAYAVAYLFTTFPQDRELVVTATSPNTIQLFVDSESTVATPGQDATLEVTLPGQSTSGLRIMVKVLQSSSDSQFGFELRLTDPSGVLPPQDTVFVKLEPEGGI